MKEKYPDQAFRNIWKRCGTTFWTIWSVQRARGRIGRSTGIAGRPVDETAGARTRSVPPVWSERDLAHGDEAESPVIFETTPTYANLFGTIQRAYDARGGGQAISWICAAGRCCGADGGFLIMYALETISEPGVWRALKRTLNHNRLEIQPLEMFYPFGGSAMKPEAVPINLKVILIGDRSMYELMYDYEEDFRKIFKVRVEFDEEMPMSDSVIAEYAADCGHCRKREFVAIRSRGVRGDSGTRRADGGAAQQSDGAICGYSRFGA